MLLLFFVLFFVVFLCVISRLKSPDYKGKSGEKKVNNVLSKLPNEYIVLNDVMFRTDSGTTQIDHIVLSPYAIFTIETKNYSGIIYGNESQGEWTQIIKTGVRYKRKLWKVYTYITKNRFYNPVKQSFGHAYAIQKMIGYKYYDLPIVPLVVFMDKADISHIKSERVICLHHLSCFINNYKKMYVSNKDVYFIRDVLLRNDISKTTKMSEHVKNIREKQRQYTNSLESGTCPLCGKRLIRRNGRYGDFIGCTGYPKCRFTC